MCKGPSQCCTVTRRYQICSLNFTLSFLSYRNNWSVLIIPSANIRWTHVLALHKLQFVIRERHHLRNGKSVLKSDLVRMRHAVSSNEHIVNKCSCFVSVIPRMTWIICKSTGISGKTRHIICSHALFLRWEYDYLRVGNITCISCKAFILECVRGLGLTLILTSTKSQRIIIILNNRTHKKRWIIEVKLLLLIWIAIILTLYLHARLSILTLHLYDLFPKFIQILLLFFL